MRDFKRITAWELDPRLGSLLRATEERSGESRKGPTTTDRGNQKRSAAVSSSRAPYYWGLCNRNCPRASQPLARAFVPPGAGSSRSRAPPGQLTAQFTHFSRNHLLLITSLNPSGLGVACSPPPSDASKEPAVAEAVAVPEV